MAAYTWNKNPMLDCEMEMALVTAGQIQESSLLFKLLNKRNGFRVFRSLCLRGVWKEEKGTTVRWLFTTLSSEDPHMVDAALLLGVTHDLFEETLKLLKRGSRKMQRFAKSQMMSKSDWYFLSMYLSPRLTNKEKKAFFLQSVRMGDYRKASVLFRFSGVVHRGDLRFLAAVCFHAGGLLEVDNVASMVKSRHEAHSLAILKFGFQVAADCIVNPVCRDVMNIVMWEIRCCKSYADLAGILLRLTKGAGSMSAFAVFLGVCVDFRIPKQYCSFENFQPTPGDPPPTNVLPEDVSVSSVLRFLAEVSFRLNCETEQKLDQNDDCALDFNLLDSLVGKAYELNGESFLFKCCLFETTQYGHGMEANQQMLLCATIRLLFRSDECDEDIFNQLAMFHTSCSHFNGNCLIHCIRYVADTESDTVWKQSCPRLEHWVKQSSCGCEPFISADDFYFFDKSKPRRLGKWCSEQSFSNLALFVSLTWEDWRTLRDILSSDTCVSQSLCVSGAKRTARESLTVPFLLFLKHIEDEAVVQAILRDHGSNPRLFYHICDDTIDSVWHVFDSTRVFQWLDVVLEQQHPLTDYVLDWIAQRASYKGQWWLVQGVIARCLLNQEVTAELIVKALRARNKVVSEQLMRLVDIHTLRKCSAVAIAICSDDVNFDQGGNMVCWCVKMGLASLHCPSPDKCPFALALSHRNLPLARLLFTVGACPNPADCCGCLLESTDEGLEWETQAVRRKRHQVQRFVSEISGKPRSLHDICCLKVSQAIGLFSEREQKAKALGLPSRLASEILFESAITDYKASQRLERPRIRPGRRKYRR